MKKLITIILVGILALSFTACGNTSNSTTDDSTQRGSTINLEEKYQGYFANFDEGIISVTNYDPDDMNKIPSYQEMIDYGDGAGLENEGTVYCIYVFDSANSTNENEIYYYAELEDETYKVLIEEDNYFSTDEEKDAVVNKLIEIMDYVKDNNNE